MATKEKPAEASGLLSTAELAGLFSYSDERIRQLMRKGVIQGKRIKGDYFFNLIAVKDYILFLRAIIDDNKKTPKDLQGLEREKLEADVLYRKNKGRKMELETKELEGKFHRTEDIEILYNTLIAIVRNAIEAIPARTGALVYGAKSINEAQTKIEDECNQVLRELATIDYNSLQFKQAIDKIMRERQGREIETSKDEDEDMDATE